MYASVRHIDSARLMPIALTLMRTSAGPGAGTVVSMNSRTSGPPTFANLIVRDIGISCVRGKRKGRLAGSRVVLCDPPHALAVGRAETASYQRVSARCSSGIDVANAF